MRDTVHFLLRERNARFAGCQSTLTALDYLRGVEKLCGTKEGCAESDRGACTVVLGEPVRARSHAKITRLDVSAAAAMPHVVVVMTTADIPGVNDADPEFPGDPIFADGLVEYHGQSTFAVAADSIAHAREAAGDGGAASRRPGVRCHDSRNHFRRRHGAGWRIRSTVPTIAVMRPRSDFATIFLITKFRSRWIAERFQLRGCCALKERWRSRNGISSRLGYGIEPSRTRYVG